MGPLLPPTATFTPRLPHVWMLFFFAMQIRCAWLWPECCFWSVSQVHILYANASANISGVWVTFSFSILYSISLCHSTSLTVCLYCCFHFWIKLFSMLKSNLWCWKCLISLFVKAITTICANTLIYSPPLSSCLHKMSSFTLPSCCPTHFIPTSHP